MTGTPWKSSLVGTMTRTFDRYQGNAFLPLQQIRPMIETVPLAPKAFGAAEAYGRMMRNEARYRIVLVTGQ
jgi:D-arabinose 1-dehydrogenase-like Zn-dependent alcohol dehydrogenase